MGVKRNPWLKFYPSDWRADKALRICSIAARGMWMELLCIMHEANPRGHLVVNGVPLTDAQLAMLTGVAPVELGALLTELETAGVFSRTRAGVIYSRRITRDERRRKDGVKSAKNGTLPHSRRSRQRSENREQNRPPPRVVMGVEDKPPIHPEARSQKLDIKKGSPIGDHKKSGPTDRNSSVDQATAQPPSPQPPPSQAVQLCRSREKPPPRDKRGTRLPEDWELGEKEAEFAGKKGFFEREIAEMADNFKDYWLSKPGKDAVKLDWSRAWNMWVRRDIQIHGPPRSRKEKNGSNPRVYNSYDAANAMRDAWDRFERKTITTIDEVPQ